MKASRILLWGLKLAVGVGLLTFLIWRMDTRSLLERLGSVSLPWLAAAFVIPHLGIVLSSVKWRILLRTQGYDTPLRRLVALYLIGTFFNNFMPSMVGGDVVRAYALGQEQGSTEAAAASTFTERLIGLVALVTMLPLALLRPEVRQGLPAVGWLIPLAAVGCALAIWVVFSDFQLRIPGIASMPPLLARVTDFARRTRTRVVAFRHAHRALLASYLISVLFYIGAACTVWLAGRAVDVPLSIGFLVCVMPMVLFIGLIPVSVNGLGTLETGYVLILGLSGASAEEALSVAILLRGRILFTAILGGVTFLTYRRGIARPVVGPEPG